MVFNGSGPGSIIAKAMYVFRIPLSLVKSPEIINLSWPGNLNTFIALNSMYGDSTIILWDVWRDSL